MSPDKSTHYQVLGISSQAESSEIQAAFQRLKDQFHPDHLPPDTSDVLRQRAEQEFELIEKAHNVLSHPLRRKAYDISLSLDEAPPPALQPAGLPPLLRDIPPIDIPQAPNSDKQPDWLFAVIVILGSLLGLALLFSVINSLRSTPTPPLVGDEPAAVIPPAAVNPAPVPAQPTVTPDALASSAISTAQLERFVAVVEALRPVYERTATQLEQTQDAGTRQRLQQEFETAATAIITSNGLTREEYQLISQLARENPQIQEAIRDRR
ncbi:MAG: hypothetical protein OHK0012_21300 [Synechococcales cyanobacterium]